MKKSKKLFHKMFFPVLAFLLILLGIYTVAVRENVLVYLKENAFSVFKEQTINCKNYAESAMEEPWTSIHNSEENITLSVEHILQENQADFSQIQTNAALNQEILKNVTEEVIDILKDCGTTEVFFILDGRSTELDNDSKAGIYIRNSAPNEYSDSNSNLLFERGIPAISKEWQIPLDIYWETGFELDEDSPESDFFYKPLKVARENKSTELHNYGFWFYGYPIEKNDVGVLSYSVPLIGSDGSVYGVLGVGFQENYFAKYLQKGNGEAGKTREYILAKTVDGKHYEVAIESGQNYNTRFYTGSTIVLEEQTESGIYYITNEQGNSFCVNKQELRLYSPNTPFEEETWVILGVELEEELLECYLRARKILIGILGGSVVVCTLAVWWLSYYINVPIQKLVKELHKSNPNKKIYLSKVQIREIDELSEAIENLSERVAAGYANISKIMDMTDAGIAIFEYKEAENLIFCSNGLYELLGWGEQTAANEYVEGNDAIERMRKLFTEEFDDREPLEKDSQKIEVVLQIQGEKERWVKICQTKEKGSILGAVMDVTQEMLEKQKIVRERNYDMLTNLMNRRAFEERMRELFENTTDLKIAAMLVWDLDNLKYVNDVYGHTTGDAYIKIFAEGLMQLCDANVISARRSGDEFVTFLFGFETEEQLTERIESIWERVHREELLLPDGRGYRISVSMGKAWYPKDAEDVHTLFRYADFAMYTAKHKRRGSMSEFQQEFYQERRLLLQGQEAFDALLENRLVKYALQPIVSVADGSIYGYEMLMRSNSEEFQNSQDILRMAQSQSKLYDIEVITWFESMKSFVAQIEAGTCSPDTKVFVNSIGNQIMNSELIELFEKIYKDYLPNVVCELTEEQQGNQAIIREKAKLMKKWHGMVAIDDYGQGYNSGAILLKVSPEIVKLDMQIVRGIHQDESRKRLAANLVLYAKEHNILVLGEGVEKKEEVETLISLGVDLLQGYYVGKPEFVAAVPPEHIRAEIKAMYESSKR